MRHIDMVEVPGTNQVANKTQFTMLLADKTAPVFEAREPAVFTEVVAVTYRSENDIPIHGGLYGVGADGVTSLALKDLAGEVDTSKDPAHIAFGLVMMRGPLTFRQDGRDQTMKLTIIDIKADELEAALCRPTPALAAVKAAYIAEILPSAEFRVVA